MLRIAIALAALVNATPAIARPITYTLQAEAHSASRRPLIVISRRLTLAQCSARAAAAVKAYPAREVVCTPE